MQWKRDQIKQRPRLATTILLAGAAIHFFLCWPLYGRRGFPELEPVYLSMVWMWIPAIPLSVLFCKLNRWRVVWLVLYAVVASYTVSWSLVSEVPNHRTPFAAAMDIVLIAPVLVAGVAGAEVLSRLVICLIRRFPSEPVCEKCGYSILHLRDPRCPECGAPFDPRWLHPNTGPAQPKGHAILSILTLLFIITVAALFPNLYSWYTRHQLIGSGRESAQTDWLNGEAKWFVTRSEENAMSPATQDRYYDEILWRTDPGSGLEIFQMRTDWHSHMWGVAYREEIERLLAKAGKSPPSFEHGSP
jgi:ribosomal protein L37E